MRSGTKNNKPKISRQEINDVKYYETAYCNKKRCQVIVTTRRYFAPKRYHINAASETVAVQQNLVGSFHKETKDLAKRRII